LKAILPSRHGFPGEKGFSPPLATIAIRFGPAHMKEVRFEAAPMLLGLVLGIMMEDALCQSLIMSGGSFQIFLSRSISAGFLLAALVLLAIPAIRGGRKVLVAKLTETE
jgi:TctA family transporter